MNMLENIISLLEGNCNDRHVCVIKTGKRMTIRKLGNRKEKIELVHTKADRLVYRTAKKHRGNHSSGLSDNMEYLRFAIKRL